MLKSFLSKQNSCKCAFASRDDTSMWHFRVNITQKKFDNIIVIDFNWRMINDLVFMAIITYLVLTLLEK